jgi:hypothetical protein
MSSEYPINEKSPSAATHDHQHSLPLSNLQPQTSRYDSASPSADSEEDMGPKQERGLYDAISEALAYSEFSQKYFLPQDKFETLVTEAAIKEELAKATQADLSPSLAGYIATHARKTFATLVIQDKVLKAFTLEEFGFDDKYLPIAVEGSRPTSLNGLTRDPLVWRWFRGWKTQEKDCFCEKQWLFLSHIFKSDSMMEDLHQHCRLPFITCDLKSEGGSFSLLHKATIHRAHQIIESVSAPIQGSRRLLTSIG